MTRAEEAALKAFPDNEVDFYIEDGNGGWKPVTQFEREKQGFIFGYEQAEKDTIERAISWIKKNTCMGVYEQELMRKELEDEE